MSKDIKVSVIIPVYNAADYLNECLLSIKNQTLDEIEVICVDDGSTDNSIEIIKEFIDVDHRFKLIKQNNQYAGVARNNGIDNANGEYLIFLDSDDFFDEKLLELTYNKAVEKDADVVLFDGRQYDTKNDKYINVSHYLRKEMIIDKDPFSRLDYDEDLFLITSLCPWTKLFKKRFVEEKHLRFQSLQNTNDAFFVVSAIAEAERITTVNERLVNYRINNNSSVQGTKKKNPLCFISAFNAIYDRLCKNGLLPDVEKGFADIFLSCCAFSLNSYRDNNIKIEVAKGIRESLVYNSDVMNHEVEYYGNKNNYYLVKSAVSAENWRKKRYRSINKDVEIIKNSNDKDYKISVVIPVYNVEKYLAECLDSIVNQTLQDIQIVCIDDGSVDDSMRIVEKYAATDDRIMVIHQSNSGLSAARNTGFEYSSGKYIYYIDSDDYLDVSALQNLYERMEKDDLDILFFGGESFCTDIDDNKFDQYYVRKNIYDGVYNGLELLKLLEEKSEYRVTACMQIAKKEFVKNHGIRFVEGILHEDNLYTFQLILRAERASVVNSEYYHRRVHSDSITSVNYNFNHCYGYFVTYMEMQNEIRNLSENYNNSFIMDIPYRVFTNVINIYKMITPEEKYYFYGMNSGEYYIFLSIVYNRIVEEETVIRNNSNATRELTRVKDILQKTYDEKSEINARLQQTYKEKSEINAKLQKTYEEKAERGSIIKNQKKEIDDLKDLLEELDMKNKKLESKVDRIENSRDYKMGNKLLVLPRKIKCILKN